MDPAPPSAVAVDGVASSEVPWLVSATADDGSGSGVERVQLYYRIGATGWTQYTGAYGGDDTSSPYAWTFVPPQGVEGLYEFCAVAKDWAGNWEAPCTAAE